MVRLENGEQRRISDVKVGDSVLAANELGQLQFSQVIMKAHDDPELTNRFQTIRTKTGRNLTLTAYHLIYKANLNEPSQDLKEIMSSKPVFASEIKKGDFVLVSDENNQMMKDVVVSNDVVIRKGISAPITAFGNIVVDDILASCYTHYDHSFVHMLFAPIRWYYDTTHLLSTMKMLDFHGSSEQEPEKSEQHWYPTTLYNFREYIFPDGKLTLH